MLIISGLYKVNIQPLILSVPTYPFYFISCVNRIHYFVVEVISHIESLRVTTQKTGTLDF